MFYFEGGFYMIKLNNLNSHACCKNVKKKIYKGINAGIIGTGAAVGTGALLKKSGQRYIDSEAEKAYKGSFNIRISPELHKQIAVCAMSNQISLNSLVEKAIQHYLLQNC